MIEQMIEYAINVVAHFGGEFNACHEAGRLAGQFPSSRPGCLLPGDPVFQVGSHFLPGYGLTGGDNRGVSPFRRLLKGVATIFLLHVFRDGIENKCMRCSSGTLSRLSDPLFEFFRQSNRGRRHLSHRFPNIDYSVAHLCYV